VNDKLQLFLLADDSFIQFINKREYTIKKINSIAEISQQVKRNEPIVCALDFKRLTSKELKSIPLLMDNLLHCETILIIDGFDKQLLPFLQSSKVLTSFLFRPLTKSKVKALLTSVRKRLEKLSELNEQVASLFESNNQLELLTTILLNEFDSINNLLERCQKLLQSKSTTEQVEQGIKLVNIATRNNKNILRKINLLRELTTKPERPKQKVDFQAILLQLVQKAQSTKKNGRIIISESLSERKIFTWGSTKLLRILFEEIINSILSLTFAFKVALTISLKLSNYLEEHFGSEFGTVELEFRSILQEIPDESGGMNYLTHQYGLSYLLIRNITEQLKGSVDIRDRTVEGVTETILTIYIPQAKE